MHKDWFGTWFDSPYYHILYHHRDHKEAAAFLDHLVDYLKPPHAANIMDLACGKGRHAIYLAQKGFDVTGLDLSARNIAHARHYANDKLHFDVHDMRHPYADNTFDYIFNMFTSFGYFATKEENEQVVKAAAKALKKGGKLIIDFLNPYTVIHHLVPTEEKRMKGIDFKITRHLDEEGFIVKVIAFTDAGHDYIFHERVKAIPREEFLDYFRHSGLEVIDVFGDYDLRPYNQNNSPRMIFVAQNSNE